MPTGCVFSIKKRPIRKWSPLVWVMSAHPHTLTTLTHPHPPCQDLTTLSMCGTIYFCNQKLLLFLFFHCLWCFQMLSIRECDNKVLVSLKTHLSIYLIVYNQVLPNKRVSHNIYCVMLCSAYFIMLLSYIISHMIYKLSLNNTTILICQKLK